jgi:hypothetical protein
VAATLIVFKIYGTLPDPSFYIGRSVPHLFNIRAAAISAKNLPEKQLSRAV